MVGTRGGRWREGVVGRGRERWRKWMVGRREWKMEK
jgi:hypothetical protein